MVLNPKTDLDGHRLVVIEPGEPGFRMPSFLPNRLRHESVACMSAVIGAKLVGLDPRNHNGVDWVQAAKAWYDPKTGLYRRDLRRHGPVVHSGIYGYWAATMGMMLAAQHPDDPEFQKHLHTTIKGFDTIAHGLGCPENPDFNGLGFNFETGKPDGRNEPMNRLGNAPSVAWPLVVGASLELDTADDRVACARAALQWHIDHPDRYELTNVMGPLAAVRLNAEHHTDIDIGAILDIWFGDKNGKGDRSRWMITAGVKVDGMTLDGLDGARWDPQGNDFHAFAMGTLQGPAWLVPVVRYDQAIRPCHRSFLTARGQQLTAIPGRGPGLGSSGPQGLERQVGSAEPALLRGACCMGMER